MLSSFLQQNASWPLKTAAILDRAGRTRHFANKQLVVCAYFALKLVVKILVTFLRFCLRFLQVANSVEKVLKIPVRQAFGGVGSFCEQVKNMMSW